jgi:hypothetical protein
MTYQAVTAPTGQRYGARKAQEDAQRAVPLPDNRAPTGSPPQSPPPSPPQDIFGPSQRPGEPLTAGAAEGPGPGQMGMLPEDGLEIMRAAVANGFDRTGAIRRLLERAAG